METLFVSALMCIASFAPAETSWPATEVASWPEESWPATEVARWPEESWPATEVARWPEESWPSSTDVELL